MNKPRCQKCANHAQIHVTEVFDSGDFEEVHLCQKCAQKYLQESDQSLGAPKSLGSMMLTSERAVDMPPCPLCHTSFSDFRTTGRLGCPHDYEVFRTELQPLLENIHGELRHIGKVPRRLPRDAQVQTRLIQLRQELQQAIAIEDYERAAKLRDDIDHLEKER